MVKSYIRYRIFTKWFYALVFILVSVQSNAQYRELIYYKVPVGTIKYFRTEDQVVYKLKSDAKFDTRNGAIRLITDTLYQVGNVRFRPDNLKWISNRPTAAHRILKNIAGSLLLVSGFATVYYGYSLFPDEQLKSTDKDAYHADNVSAIGYCFGGLAISLISIPVYGIHPKRYSDTKRWRVKYQR